MANFSKQENLWRVTISKEHLFLVNLVKLFQLSWLTICYQVASLKFFICYVFKQCLLISKGFYQLSSFLVWQKRNFTWREKEWDQFRNLFHLTQSSFVKSEQRSAENCFSHFVSDWVKGAMSLILSRFCWTCQFTFRVM